MSEYCHMCGRKFGLLRKSYRCELCRREFCKKCTFQTTLSWGRSGGGWYDLVFTAGKIGYTTYRIPFR